MSDEPRRLPMFPLSTVLFPHAELPLHVFEPRYRQLTADCLAGDGDFGVVLIDRGSEVGGGDRRLAVGTVAHIVEAAPLDDGRWVLVTEGTERIGVAEWLDDAPYPTALVTGRPSTAPAAEGELLTRATSLVRRCRALLSELGDVPALAGDLELGQDPEERAWRLCALAPLNQLDGQALLEHDDADQRLALLVELCGAMAEDLSRLLATG